MEGRCRGAVKTKPHQDQDVNKKSGHFLIPNAKVDDDQYAKAPWVENLPTEVTWRAWIPGRSMIKEERVTHQPKSLIQYPGCR